MGHTVGELILASTDHGSALAYAEWDDPDANGLVRTTLKLRRLNADGVPNQGASVVLGSAESSAHSKLALASNGSQYLACWESGAHVACATVDAGQGGAFAALTVLGDSPALTVGGGSFVLSTLIPGHVALTRVGSDGKATGNPGLVDAPADANPTNLLTATAAGLLVVTGGAPVKAHPLDSAFAPLGAPIDLGVHYWIRSAIATTGKEVALSLSKPYGTTLFLFAGDVLTSTQELSGGGKTGMNVALASDGATFAMLSANDQEGGFDARSINGNTVIDLEKGQYVSQGRYDDASLALLGGQGPRLFAAVQSLPDREIILGKMTYP